MAKEHWLCPHHQTVLPCHLCGYQQTYKVRRLIPNSIYPWAWKEFKALSQEDAARQWLIDHLRDPEYDEVDITMDVEVEGYGVFEAKQTIRREYDYTVSKKG